MQAIETLENEPFYDHCRPVFGAPQVLQSVGQFRLQNQSSFEAVHLVQTLHLHTSEELVNSEYQDSTKSVCGHDDKKKIRRYW